MITCQFCRNTNTIESGDFQLDQFNMGFWCEDCDGYTFLNEETVQHRFTLIMEEKNGCRTEFQPSNIKFSKRLSPYRYPGGSRKL